MSTATQVFGIPRTGVGTRVREYAELIKARVTSLIVMTAWAGYTLGAGKSGLPALSWTLIDALLGVGLVSGGAAAFNEVMERKTDARMRRTSGRPLVTRTMTVSHAATVAVLMIGGGVVYLSLACNLLTGMLALATAAAYLFLYTPLKKIHPVCTFIGAVPGAMPPVLGWTAIRGRLDWEALVLFAILFFWQFPHFHSIAWLYREDYERAGIRMLPVIRSETASTARSITGYAILLCGATLIPTLMGFAGAVYLVAAVLLAIPFLWASVRILHAGLTPGSPHSKPYARQLLRVTVMYLPLLFAVMMLDRS